MKHETFDRQDNIIQQMAHAVLSDIFRSVIDEFEKETGAKIGSINISAGHEITDHRRISINFKNVSEESLIALMRYKKMLCEHEPLKNSDFCQQNSN